MGRFIYIDGPQYRQVRTNKENQWNITSFDVGHLTLEQRTRPRFIGNQLPRLFYV